MTVAILTWATATAVGAEPMAPSPYAAWKNGLPADSAFFPIAVWMQDPALAEKYQAAGINLYVALASGPTEAQLTGLKAAGMRVFCEQNTVGLAHRHDPTIAGWLLPDEPDNARKLPDSKTGKMVRNKPTDPREVVKRCEHDKAADPTRPVLVNLGQGVANDLWVGRAGFGSNEEYFTYAKGADIVSFDVYPVADVRRPAGNDHLELVAVGVTRLRHWAGDAKPVWNCIECTHIYDANLQATPRQVKAEVWMSLIHGSRGLIYFVHQFKPTLNEHALLDDPPMLAAVTAINRQIHELAPVLNSPAVVPGTTVTAADDAPIAATTRQHDGATYVFAVGMTGKPSKGKFAAPNAPIGAKVEVIDEGRTVDLVDGKFSDAFEAWGVHLYRIR